MFHFSDDCDEDIEALLSISLDKSVIENDHQKNIKQVSIKKKDICNTLNDCNENALLLSVIDEVGSRKQTGKKNTSQIRNCHDDFDRTVNLEHSCPNYTSTKHKLPLTDSTSNSKVPKIEYERKFPGPAGLIAKHVKNGSVSSPNQGSCTYIQTPTVDLLENCCWKRLIEEVQCYSKLQTVLNQNTVAIIKRVNIIQHQPRKLPFFIGVISQINCTSCDPNVILKDLTGEIHAIFYKDLWVQYHKFLTIGSALLLKQISVLSITGSRKLYMNVTSNNIVKIYTLQKDNHSVLTQELMSITELEFNSPIKNKEKSSSKEINLISEQKKVPCMKADSTKNVFSSVNETVSKFSSFESEIDRFSNSSVLSLDRVSNSKVEKDVVFSELEGIDADSLFGEF